MYFIWYIIIGIVAGLIAGKIMRGGGFGLLINLLVGIVGGVLGGWVFGLLGITTTGLLGSLFHLCYRCSSIIVDHILLSSSQRELIFKFLLT